MAKKVHCPYGFVSEEDNPLPCETTDDYNCVACATVAVADSIHELQEEGMPLYVVVPEGVEQGGRPGEVPRRAKKAPPK